MIKMCLFIQEYDCSCKKVKGSMSSIKRSAKGVEALQLSHVESQPFYSLERQQSYTCCVLGRPSSKSMTNYLEEKTDKDCTFEG